ncbi:MAG: hypothetical protein NC324_02325 [Bacteroides sp.]|nr:hypothetical protein [Bacteroides sp.]
MNRTFLIIVLVGCIALYLFWDDIVAQRNKTATTPTKQIAVAKNLTEQKFTASMKVDSTLVPLKSNL